MDLKVPAVDGSQWTTAERQREEKSLCGNDLQTLLDFCGSPQNDAVERAKGVEPSSSAWEAEVMPLYDARTRPHCRRPGGGWQFASQGRRPAATMRLMRMPGDNHMTMSSNWPLGSVEVVGL